MGATRTDTERQPASSADSSTGPDQATAPIEELNLPVRSYNSLRREGVHTVGGLAALNEQDLLAIEGLGPASVKEIRQRLADRGLSLGTVTGANGGAAAPAGPATQATQAAGPSPMAGMAADRDLAASNGLLPPQGVRPPDEDALDLLSMAGLPVLERGTAGSRRGLVRRHRVQPATQAPPPGPRLSYICSLSLTGTSPPG